LLVLRRKTQRAKNRRKERLRGAGDFGSLIRKPAVQVTLVLAAVVQFAAVQGGESSDGVLTAFELAPVLVSEPNLLESEIAEAWRVKALERESERLLTEYRSRGYPVTPKLAHQISEAAVEQGIEPALAFGLVRAESSFRTQATSRGGCGGADAADAPDGGVDGAGCDAIPAARPGDQPADRDAVPSLPARQVRG
jgi:hypothetical protein